MNNRRPNDISEHALPTESAVHDLGRFIIDHQPLFVLTGAGCSTRSGLADYRDQAGNWKRQQPITASKFIHDEKARQRYWARSIVGWQSFDAATANATHRGLAALQSRHFEQRLVTQNVDGLHQLAGHQRVVELHGSLASVICLTCGTQQPRRDFQQQLLDHNPALNPLTLEKRATPAPDGDADLNISIDTEIKIPACQCGGLIKPNVVFFGENVPRPRVEECLDALHQSRGMLVVGSSLMVYSGYRFCKRAAQASIPIASVNLGVTRADDLLTLNLQGDCARIITQVLAQL